MKYNTAFPYFSDTDVEYILSQTRRILEGDEMLSMGRFVSEFETAFSQYVNTEYAVATSSCTTALETVLTSFDLSQGDEVIVPCQTFIATASSVVRVGAKPVFAEVGEDFLIDFESLKEKITANTKAVIVVHFAGLIHPEIFHIKKYLAERDIRLIEDAAHAHGASIKGIKAGNIGDAACFSFFSTKNMTAGEGGMITTNNKQIADVCSSIRNRGIVLGRGGELFDRIGSNLRMTEFQALIGMVQLERLDQFVMHRQKVASVYEEKLKRLVSNGSITRSLPDSDTSNSYWRYWIRLNDEYSREQVQAKLAEKSIKIDWAYTPLVHLQPIFVEMYGFKEGDLPRSDYFASNHICLPIHYLITTDDAVFIAESLIEVLEELKGVF